MPKGTIVKYTNRGFGFIRLDRAGPDTPDIFFHVRDFFCGDFGTQPQVDDIVVFKIVTEHKDKRLDARPLAIRVRLIVREGSFWSVPAPRPCQV
jgi:cold shock CspA family protein